MIGRLLPALFLVSAVTAAQTPAPPRRAHHSLVYDDAGKRVLLTGGSAPMDGGRSYVFFNDTWAFDGQHWKELGEAGQKLSGAQLAYDTKRNRVVSYGGFDGSASLDGTRWTQKQVSGPGLRGAAGATFDPKRGVVVIFGGSGGGAMFGDTWSCDGTSWRKLADTGPEPRAMGYIAYDKARDRVVLFGGRKGWPDGDLNDTWEWNGAKWTRISP